MHCETASFLARRYKREMKCQTTLTQYLQLLQVCSGEVMKPKCDFEFTPKPSA